MFLTKFERQLDDKGRVALPVPHRSLLDDRCYLTVGQNRCIDVWPPGDFEQNVSEIDGRVKRGELPISRLRAIAHGASESSIDKQGRIKVDQHLREYARIELSSKLVVAGTHDHIELWSPSGYAAAQDRLYSEMDDE